MRSYKYRNPDWFLVVLCILHVLISFWMAFSEGWQSGLRYFVGIPLAFLLFILGNLFLLLIVILVLLLIAIIGSGVDEGVRKVLDPIKKFFLELK